LLYSQKAYILRDSIVSKISDSKMLEVLTKYETKKKEATISAQEHKISQQKLIQTLSLTLVALLISILVIGFIGLLDRNKTYRKLALKNTENELLIKEIHHRVKNNLEMVSSLLALQSEQINDPKTKEAITEGKNRVNSIGIVHQKLYQGDNLGHIEMKEYFMSLSESILDSLGAEDRIELKIEMKKLDLDIDTAIPLGLIINELLTNAIKYAFPLAKKGTISIKLEKQNHHILHLEVSDNGIGKSDSIQGTGFGGKLISLLTHQLNGTMTEKIQNGTTIQFDFKLNESV
jgi:two-component system, sensor histidine kinase PdtaS